MAARRFEYRSFIRRSLASQERNKIQASSERQRHRISYVHTSSARQENAYHAKHIEFCKVEQKTGERLFDETASFQTSQFVDQIKWSNMIHRKLNRTYLLRNTLSPENCRSSGILVDQLHIADTNVICKRKQDWCQHLISMLINSPQPDNISGPPNIQLTHVMN